MKRGFGTHLFNQYLLSTYYVLNTVASTGNIAKKEEALFSKGLFLGVPGLESAAFRNRPT